MEVMRKRQ